MKLISRKFFPSVFPKKKQNTMTIFLDVDGVLNCEKDWKTPFVLNPQCVEVLGKIAQTFRKKYNRVDIVLSSTWRQGKNGDGRYDKSAFQKLENVLKEMRLSIVGTTPVTGNIHTRWEEIEFYIKRNGVGRFIILDDDESLFPNWEECRLPFYITNYKPGLVEADIKRVLNKVKF